MKKWKRAALVCAAMITVFAQTAQMAASALGNMDFSSPMAKKLINQVSFANIAPGISEQQITLLNSEGKRVENFIMTIDLKGEPTTDIVTGSYQDSTGYGMSSMRSQAEAAEAHGKNVVGAVNADFYDMSTGVPIGCFIKDGKILKELPNNWSFFGIKKDGSAVTGDYTKYAQVRGDLKEALGGNCVLVRDGAVIDYSGSDDSYFSTKQPRTAAGIKADGSVVFMVSDGRQDPYSTGLTMWDLGNMMKDLGCVDAINLDGGGSSTYLSREQGTDTLACKNSPSDGSERAVANGFLVLSNAQGDGTFRYAAVAPADKTYTPNSKVQVTAKGMDSAGNPAPLPAQDLSWELSDGSYGSVDANGLVTSSGKEGQVQVLLKYQGETVGSTYIEFVTPDRIFFRTDEISLPFDEASDLGFVAQYQERNVILKDGDITWEGTESLGTMENNILHTSPSGSVSGTVTAKLNGPSLTDSIGVQVGQLPVIMYDFEDGLSGWTAGTAGRGEKTSVSVVDYASGEPVRFGDKSLKLNFDLTNAQVNKTLGAYAGPAEELPLPGMPKAIGAWVYATEEAQGYWLRCYVYDSTHQYKPVDFASEINWIGWKYCEASLDGISGPITSFPNQMFRMMSLKSGVSGPMTKGEIYIDNVRAVYGASVDDMHPPIINDINVDGKTLTTSAVTISTSFTDDLSDQYATGMDYSKINVLIDGVNYKDAEGIYALNKGQNTVSLQHISLPDGVHRTDVVVRDNFGNETTKTAYFTVDTGTGTKVSLEPQKEGNATLGTPYPLRIVSNNAGDVKTIETTVQLTKGIPVESVTFADGFAGTHEYDQNKGLLTLSANRETADASADGSIATIQVGVPGTLSKDSKIDYSVKTGKVTYVSEKPEHYLGTFSGRPQSAGVDAAYQIEVLSNLVGRDGRVRVTDLSGKPAAGVTVNLTADGSTAALGETDEQGIVVSPAFTDKVKSFELYAQKDGALSFRVKGQTLKALGTAEPYNILANAVKDAAHAKNISWLSNPLTGGTPSILQIAKKTEYDSRQEAAFQAFNGTGTEAPFTGSTDINENGIVRLNSAVATGLEPETEYVYRVGDGERWSELRSFVQPAEDADTNFFVLGDTQTANTANLKSVMQALSNDGKHYDFGAHVGDIIDDAGRYDQLDAVSAAFSSWDKNSVDVVRVPGNHEYMGDDNATIAKQYYNFPTTGTEVDNQNVAYSVEYGNVYIAVLGFNTSREDLQAKLNWLREDVKKTDKQWKILLTHQPVYFSNPAGGNGLFKEMLPPVMDELGFDFVFSGHDHAYGRTKSLKNGAADQGGTVYLICGSTGEKYYDAVDDGSFEVFNDEQKPCYLTVSATESQFTVTTLRPDGTQLDTYTKNTPDTDKEALETIVKEAGKQESEGKIDRLIPKVQESFRKALEQAEYIFADRQATQEEVDAAVASLTEEMKKLDQVKGDKSRLQSLYDTAKDYPLDLYPDGEAKDAFLAARDAAEKILKDENALQPAVDDAESALRSAIEQMVRENSRARLNDLIAACEALDESRFEAESWANLQAKLSAAKEVAGNPDATSETIGGAIDQLAKARNDLVYSVDKEILRLSIELAQKTDTTGCTPGSIAALNEALEAAQNVLNQADATQDEVNDAAKALLNAVINLKDIKADLQKLADLAAGLTEAKYTPASWSTVRAALEAAQTLLSDDNATQEAVDGAYGTLAQAIAHLTLRAQTNSLNVAIELTQTIVSQLDQYVPATVEGLQEKLDAAKAVQGNLNATQEEVDAAAKALAEAAAKARLKANKKDLQQTYAQAQKLDAGKYTEASVRQLNRVLAATETVLKDENATQQEVDKAKNALTDAVQALEAKPTGTTSEPESSSPSDPSGSDSVPDGTSQEEGPSSSTQSNGAGTVTSASSDPSSVENAATGEIARLTEYALLGVVASAALVAIILMIRARRHSAL